MFVLRSMIKQVANFSLSIEFYSYNVYIILIVSLMREKKKRTCAAVHEYF